MIVNAQVLPEHRPQGGSAQGKPSPRIWVPKVLPPRALLVIKRGQSLCLMVVMRGQIDIENGDVAHVAKRPPPSTGGGGAPVNHDLYTIGQRRNKQAQLKSQSGNGRVAPKASSWRYSWCMATIQIKHIPDDVHRKLRTRAASAGQSLQQYMLDVVCRQAEIATIEELMARKRAEAIAFGEIDLDPELIVEVIRTERDSR